MPKKRVYSPRSPCDIKIDEKGQGTFNAYPILSDLYLTFQSIFSPTDAQIDRLYEAKYEAWANCLVDERPKMKKPSWEEAKVELLESKKAHIERCYAYAHKILKEELGPFMDKVIRDLTDEIASRTLNNLDSHVLSHIEGNAKTKIKNALNNKKSRTRQLLGMTDPGRVRGTGLFNNEREFLIALRDVMEGANKELSQPELLFRLTRHSLCQGKPFSHEECQSRGKTLRNWFDRCGINWESYQTKYPLPEKANNAENNSR